MADPRGSLSWFEIPVGDFARAKSFYEQAFEIEMQLMDAEGAQMALFESNGELGGAIVAAPGNSPSQTGSLVYLSGGDDLQGVLDRIPAAGGKVIREKTAIAGGFGNYAEFTDPDGNRVGLHSS